VTGYPQEPIEVAWRTIEDLRARLEQTETELAVLRTQVREATTVVNLLPDVDGTA
jgi:hypothetical protein